MRFISAPTKLLILIVSSLLIISIGFSILSFKRIQTEFDHFQAESLKKGKEHWKVHNHLLNNQLRTWLESFSDMILKDPQHNFNDVKTSLLKQYDTLQLHLNVDNLWFVDQNQHFLFSSAKIPFYINNKIQHVLSQQIPVNEIYCDKTCHQLIIIPLLDQQGHIAAVATTASLVDVLYSMKRTLISDVAIIDTTNNDIGSARIILASNAAFIRKVLPLIKDNPMTRNTINNVRQHGFSFVLNNRNYLLNLLLIAQNKQHHFYLALVNDVTYVKKENEHYLQQFVFSIIFIFIFLAVLIYAMTFPLSKRLLRLSNALPLLAKKNFKEFRSTKLKRRHWFADELDVLSDAALSLSYELEQLNLQVEQKTKELENIAMYDLLTGLPNRNMLNYQLKKMLSNLSRSKTSVAVLFLDLDDFKKVNDSHGHAQGDNLLIEAAQRIRSCLDTADFVCRFGGDEFVVCISQNNVLEEAEIVANNLLKQFATPIKITNNVFYVSTSIGIAFTDDVSMKAEKLISQADMAMSKAKSQGGDKYFIYQDTMHSKVVQQVMLETEVRQALVKNQFSLSLQPQIRAKDHKLFGFEVLLRWQHPILGMISPEDFIPMLEKTGYMVELGYWIIRHSFELAKQLQTKLSTDTCIAINLTASQFADPQLFNFLQKLLLEFNLSASCIELELTEQTLVTEIDLAIEVMNKLKVLGFRFAIDDFGTGYSSLAYIKRMPIDVIKIDKSFIFGMLENYADYQIIKSTIAMVKNLDLVAVAEGVETSAQLRSLTVLDCDLIQGYYFSKPIPETELFEFIQAKIEQGFWKTKIDKVS